MDTDINYNGNIYIIKQDNIDSNDVFMKKAWYIAKRQPTNKDEFDRYTIAADIWKNIVYHGVGYPREVEDII